MGKFWQETEIESATKMLNCKHKYAQIAYSLIWPIKTQLTHDDSWFFGLYESRDLMIWSSMVYPPRYLAFGRPPSDLLLWLIGLDGYGSSHARGGGAIPGWRYQTKSYRFQSFQAYHLFYACDSFRSIEKGQLFYLTLPSQVLSFRKFCPTPIEMFINNKGSSEVPHEPDRTSWIMEQQVLQNLLMPPHFNWSCQTMAHPLLSCGSCGFWVG